ncbi:MAG TPA: TauD/TfdA family dioxygenase [Ktedonobacteraceae bacterium]|nr:TauD/TfdA family dioxygenase [Ktedonobacteraceae bacterium]
MAVTYQALKQHIVEIKAREASALARFLREQSFNPYASAAEMERLVVESVRLVKLLPDELLKTLLAFRAHSNDEGVLVVRGLPLDDSRIGPTPLHWSTQAQTKTCYDSEMCLLGIASLLGDVFAFSAQHQGSLIQNVLPTPADASDQSGSSSAVFLDWHTEDACHCCRASFVALLCLRSHPAAATTFASIKKMDLPRRYLECLFQPRFRITCFDDSASGAAVVENGPTISVLYGCPDDPYVRYDAYCIQPDPGDSEAEEALACFASQIGAAARQVILQQGDLLLLDNHRVVHGRTAFTPRFDGSDRWLQRALIAADLRKSRAARLDRLRVIETSDHSLLGC